MNPIQANGGIFVRHEIIKLIILNDRDKMLLAVIDNYDKGFNEDFNGAAKMLLCSETQASNSFEKLRSLQYIRRADVGPNWVLNEDGPWIEGSK